jgi:hypothetical protein
LKIIFFLFLSFFSLFAEDISLQKNTLSLTYKSLVEFPCEISNIVIGEPIALTSTNNNIKTPSFDIFEKQSVIVSSNNIEEFSIDVKFMCGENTEIPFLFEFKKD